MGIVTNDKNQNSRPIDEQCNYFCGPGDIESWSRAIKTLSEQAYTLIGSQENQTTETKRLGIWAVDNEPYSDAATGVGLGINLLKLYGPMPVSNSDVVKDMARRAEDGDTLLRSALESVGQDPGPSVAGSLDRPQATRGGPGLGYLLLLGGAYYLYTRRGE